MKYKITLLLAALLLLFSLKTYAQEGSNDPTFNPGDTGYSNGTDNSIAAVVLQPDGKIILGGYFSRYDLQPIKGIVRINPDESLDETFLAGTGVDNNVQALAQQPDGKILVGGTFSSYNNIPAGKIVRINPDGTIDTSFNVGGSGTDATVNKIILQPDGKIIILGGFAFYNGTQVFSIVRLNANGTQDATFTAGNVLNFGILDVALQQDGKIIAVGNMTTFNAVPVTKIIRLNANGTPDTSFNVTMQFEHLTTVAVLPNGKIVTGGLQNTAGVYENKMFCFNTDGTPDAAFLSQPLNLGLIITCKVLANGKILVGGNDELVQLNENGSTDTGFTAGIHNGAVISIGVATDNSIYAAGYFLKYNGLTENYIVRLHSNGVTHEDFNMGLGTGCDNIIKTMVNAPDGRIIITGDFNHYNGIACNGIARLTSDGLYDDSYNVGLGANGLIKFTALAPEGKLIIFGTFTSYNGSAANHIARLNADGSLDATFSSGEGFEFVLDNDYSVMALAIQPDGKIIAGGTFTSYHGSPCAYAVRINTDGTYDATFNTAWVPADINYQISKILVTADGQGIYVANRVGQATAHLVKLTANGAIDASFTPLDSAILSQVEEVAIREDGKLLVAGVYFGSVMPLYRLVRINTNGTLDAVLKESDMQGENYFTVEHIFPQADNKLIITGGFWMYNGYLRAGFIRTYEDGSLDLDFASGSDAYYYDIDAILPQQGKLVIAGDFTSYGGAGRNRIARIGSTGILNTQAPIAASKNNLIVYKENNALNVKASQNVISSIEVYDLRGRLLANTTKVDGNAVAIKNLPDAATILIVKVTYNNNTTQTRKIYY